MSSRSGGALVEQIVDIILTRNIREIVIEREREPGNLLMGKIRINKESFFCLAMSVEYAMRVK